MIFHHKSTFDAHFQNQASVKVHQAQVTFIIPYQNTYLPLLSDTKVPCLIIQKVLALFCTQFLFPYQIFKTTKNLSFIWKRNINIKSHLLCDFTNFSAYVCNSNFLSFPPTFNQPATNKPFFFFPLNSEINIIIQKKKKN